MVEAPVRPTQTTDNSADEGAEGRGTLDVRNKALQHIIERVVLQVPGTVTRHSALGRITGMALPKADITTEGRSAVVKVDVAMAWPGNISQVATAARDTVRQEAFRLSGIQIRSVDVTVHAVDPATAEDTRRVE
ncbi:putative alkaline shock family protein YloU [Nocardioides albertanoniae]|uniref:Putative alkaline shock family protein YloU n=1 Tax=Nocardioides albertanoniae TaxID=1175486 RepID=A0A543A5T1_9ACTN|nr:Asp23/Gls24 family envelope stress response protein [Nocardioides albertanoniae]TQL67907.1 putative alkaline shock family protein YloU [Nocardioides albertanoniae]